MLMRVGLCSGALAAALLVPVARSAAQPLPFPLAARGSVVASYFGRAGVDPYRPLENLDAPATTAWGDSENAVTFGYLAGIARRDSIRIRLTALWNYPRVTVPVREAGELWFRKNTGLQKQSVLYRETTLGGRPALVLDPNALSPDGSIAVAQWSVSSDGRTLGYTTSVRWSDLPDLPLLH